MKNKLTYKTYIVPALFLIVILIVLVKFTIPQAGQIMDARRELQQEKDRLERLIKKSTELENIDEESLKNNFQITEDALPSEKDVAGFIAAIVRVENEATVTSKKFQFKPGLISTPAATPSPATPSGEQAKKQAEPQAVQTKEKSSLSSLDSQISIEGAFINVRNFLEKIKEINPILAIPDLKLSQNVKEREKTTLNLKMLLYYQPLPMSLGKIEDSLPVITSKDEEVLAAISRLPIYSELPLEASPSIGKINPFE